MSIDVYDDISSSLSNIYSMHAYIGNTSWDTIKSQIQALIPAGSYTLQLPGRLDVASNNIYNTPLLDWVLIIYNNIFSIGYDQGEQVPASLSLTLSPANTAGFTYVTESPLTSGNTQVLYTDIDFLEKVATPYSTANPYIFNYGFGSSSPAVLSIDFTPTANPRLTNLSNNTISFRAAYTDTLFTSELDVGTILQYPSITGINAILQKAVATEDTSNLSFSRL